MARPNGRDQRQPRHTPSAAPGVPRRWRRHDRQAERDHRKPAPANAQRAGRRSRASGRRSGGPPGRIGSRPPRRSRSPRHVRWCVDRDDVQDHRVSPVAAVIEIVRRGSRRNCSNAPRRDHQHDGVHVTGVVAAGKAVRQAAAHRAHFQPRIEPEHPRAKYSKARRSARPRWREPPSRISVDVAPVVMRICGSRCNRCTH